MDTPAKRCTKCGESYPLTTEYFHKDSQKKDGFYSSCIKCRIGHWYVPPPPKPPKPKRIKKVVEPKPKREPKPKQTVEQRRERDRKYRQRRIAKDPQWHQADLARKREAQRRRRRQNPQKYIDYQTEYRKKHPEKLREDARCWSANRRARSRSTDGKYTTKDVKAQLKSQNGKCWWCGKKVKKYDVDHLVPLSRGGTNHPNNIVIACPHCNRSRHNKLPHEWTDRLL